MAEKLSGIHEETPEQILMNLVLLASTQPKVDHWRPGDATIHTQYRDNFFRRFGELKAIREERATDEQVFYVRMVKERFGLDLLTFYADQETLCEAICEAVEAKDPYDQLVEGHAALLEYEQAGQIARGSADTLNTSVGHPLGIEAIGIYYWNRINPLLDQAYTALEPRTLNAPFLAK